jgi:hypothetical protein
MKKQTKPVGPKHSTPDGEAFWQKAATRVALQVSADASVDVTGANWRNCDARGGEATAACTASVTSDAGLRFVRRLP